MGDVGLLGAPDRAIWDYAKGHGFIIVTKDEDFHRFSVLYGLPPKVIWLRIGNCSTGDIIRLLQDRAADIQNFVDDEEAAFLALA